MVTKKVASKKKVATVAPVAKAVPLVITEVTKDQAIKVLVQAGVSLENVAEQLGVTVEYVKELAKQG